MSTGEGGGAAGTLPEGGGIGFRARPAHIRCGISGKMRAKDIAEITVTKRMPE